jgi:hypothetical protein
VVEPEKISKHMRARDLIRNMNTYAVKIRLPQTGYTTIMNTTVQARTPEMARRMIRSLYGSRTALVTQPVRISPR